MCKYLATAQKWMSRLLLQQCHLLPQIAPSHVDWETTALFTQRSCNQFCLLSNNHINLKKGNSWFFSDSLSALQALGKLKTDHTLLIQIQELWNKINADQKEIVVWDPGQVGIRGSEAADRAAKETLYKKTTKKLFTKKRQPISCLFRT